MSSGIRPLAPYRVVISRTLIGLCLFFLVWRGLSGLLPHQLQQPVLTSFHYDITMWLYKLSGLAYLVAQQPQTSVLFTILLFATGVLSWWFPLQRRFTIPFTFLFFLLAVNFNFYLTHNSHYLAGFVWLLFCLWPSKEEHFALFWDGLRYYACWIYGGAFVWKLLYGAFFQWDAGVLSCRENLAGYLFQNPETMTAHFYYWMFDHPILLNLGHKMVCLAEGAFLLGFFTRRFDKHLILMLFLIHLSTWLFADVFFAELMILGLTFIPVNAWQWLWYKTVPNSVHQLQKKIS
jgi:hypothetical protein